VNTPDRGKIGLSGAARAYGVSGGTDMDGEALARDGKTLHVVYCEQLSGVRLVSASAQDQGIVSGQRSVGEKKEWPVTDLAVLGEAHSAQREDSQGGAAEGRPPLGRQGRSASLRGELRTCERLISFPWALGHRYLTCVRLSTIFWCVRSRYERSMSAE
jgi:hypothetical protein